MNDRPTRGEASSVTLAYSPADDEDVSAGLDEDSFRSYLRKAHGGSIDLGDEFEEFVNCGCGSTKDVTLQVVSITGAQAIGPGTDIEYEPAK